MDKYSTTPMIPMYRQLADTLKEQILSGKLKESDKLMTETELGEHYHVSRITVRKAIDILSDEEYVIKKQGIGTFVTSKKINRIIYNKVLSFTQMCELAGSKPSSDVLSVSRVNPTAKVIKQMQLSGNELILCVVRVRKCDDKPVMLETTYFAPQLGDLDNCDFSGSIHALLRSRGTVIAHATKTVSICYATDREGELLEVHCRQPLLLHDDLGMDERGYCKW